MHKQKKQNSSVSNHILSFHAWFSADIEKLQNGFYELQLQKVDPVL